MSDKLTRGERFILEWQYDLLGSFSTNIAKAISCADGYNLEKLELAFPEEVKAYRKFTGENEWWNNVKIKARKAGYNI